jgi:hypothetical protein
MSKPGSEDNSRLFSARGKPDRAKVGLPARPFLYTMDQISAILDVDIRTVATQYLYFEGRSTGVRDKHFMLARNIAPPDERPDWRVAERELIRWMRVKGFRYYERGTVGA